MPKPSRPGGSVNGVRPPAVPLPSTASTLQELWVGCFRVPVALRGARKGSAPASNASQQPACTVKPGLPQSGRPPAKH